MTSTTTDAMTRRLATIAVFLLLLLAAAVWLSGLFTNCCGARPEPSRSEAVLARTLRSLSMSHNARDQKNPTASTPEVLQKAARHFADHCASCHGNDGRGDTPLGLHVYPRSPDMRQRRTQDLTDGELYYIIHNGVRWTAMPAWGASDYDPESWELVLFIRHLPSLTAAELHDMERYNPQSPAEIQEQQEEEKFLNGDTSTAPDTKPTTPPAKEKQ
jgi:mono/diheme cytochrome c family protein